MIDVRVSCDDLDDFEMPRVTLLDPLWSAGCHAPPHHRAKTFHTDFRDSVLFIRSLSTRRYLSLPVFLPPPLSPSARCKNRNIEVFGHCPILSVRPYLRAEFRRCSGGRRRCGAENGGMDRDKQERSKKDERLKRRNVRRARERERDSEIEGYSRGNREEDETESICEERERERVSDREGGGGGKRRRGRREKRRVNEPLLTF